MLCGEKVPRWGGKIRDQIISKLSYPRRECTFFPRGNRRVFFRLTSITPRSQAKAPLTDGENTGQKMEDGGKPTHRGSVS